MIQPSDLEHLMRGRRSIRQYKQRAPSDEQIARVLEAAQLAPSASNKQPWRFVVVAAPETIRQMASVVREVVARIEARLLEDSRDAFLNYGSYFTRFEAAPRVIVPLWRGQHLLSNLVDSKLEPERLGAILATERDSSLLGCSLALMNLLLMAHAEGLGASCMTGPLLAAPELAALLDVPSGWQLAAVVPIGYADESPARPPRKSTQRVTRWIR